MKKAAILILCLVPSAIAAWSLRDLPHLGSFHDDGIYFVTARSLALEHQYKIASLPGEPWQTKYPPAYAAYLALAWILNPSFPSNVAWAALLAWLWFPAFVAGAWYFFKSSGAGEWPALGLAAVTALLPQSLLASNSLMSDLAFSGLLLWCLYLAERKPRLAGLLAGVAYLTRTAALPLLLAVPAVHLIRRQHRSAFQFLAAALPMAVGWHVWVALVRQQGSDEVTLYYTDYLRYQLQTVPLAQLPGHIWGNLGLMVSQISNLLALDPGGSWPLVLLRPVIVAACVSGVVRMARKGTAVPYAIFAALYCAMLAAWYYMPAGRFLVPVLPLLLVGFWTEMQHVIAMMRRSWPKDRVGPVILATALAGMAALFISNLSDQYSTAPKALAAERNGREQVAAAYDWVRRSAGSDATFFAVNDPVFYLETGRHALRRAELGELFAKTDAGVLRPSQGFLQFIREQNLSHVLITAKDFEPATMPLNFDLAETGLRTVFQNDRALILEVGQVASLGPADSLTLPRKTEHGCCGGRDDASGEGERDVFG